MSHPEFVDELMKRCIGCRKCEKVCPSYRFDGCSPSLTMKGEPVNVEKCIGCGKCNTVCERTDPKTVMAYLKAEKLGLKVPDVFLKHGYVLEPLPKGGTGELPPVKTGKDAYIMPGCIVKGKLPFLVYSALKTFEVLGLGAEELPGNTCCMYPLPLINMDPCERDAYKYRMRTKADGKDIVTLCSGCTIELGRAAVYAPNLCTYLSRYLDRIRALPGVRMKVSMEPGCSSERFEKDMRAIIEATGAEIVNDRYGCCGKNIPGVSQKNMEERMEESKEADVIVLGCPNCFVFYDNLPEGKPVLHLSELIALAAGDKETQRYHKHKLKE